MTNIIEKEIGRKLIQQDLTKSYFCDACENYYPIDKMHHTVFWDIKNYSKYCVRCHSKSQQMLRQFEI